MSREAQGKAACGLFSFGKQRQRRNGAFSIYLFRSAILTARWLFRTDKAARQKKRYNRNPLRRRGGTSPKGEGAEVSGNGVRFSLPCARKVLQRSKKTEGLYRRSEKRLRRIFCSTLCESVAGFCPRQKYVFCTGTLAGNSKIRAEKRFS